MTYQPQSLRIVAIFIGLLIPLAIQAESEQADATVYKLLDAAGGQEMFDKMRDSISDQIMRTYPSGEAYVETVNRWARQYYRWEDVKDKFAMVYQRYFSEGEMKQLIEFYQSPVGKKFIEISPTLSRELMTIGMQTASQHQDKLAEMLQQREQELQEMGVK